MCEPHSLPARVASTSTRRRTSSAAPRSTWKPPSRSPPRSVSKWTPDRAAITARPSRTLLGNRKLLHAAPGRGFADVEISLRVDAHPVRPEHLADLPAAAAEFADDFQVGAPQDPDFMVGAVGDIQPLLLCVGREDRHECRTGGQRCRRDHLLSEKLALVIEHLDAVAAAIRS